MGDTTAEGARCPRCSAAVRPGAPWCTQCYAPAGAPAAAPAQRPSSDRVRGVGQGVEPAPAQAAGVEVLPTASTGTWPCPSCATGNDLALAVCEGCGAPFLAALREQRPTVVLPWVGDVVALTPARRLLLASCSVLAFLLVTALLALLLA